LIIKLQIKFSLKFTWIKISDPLRSICTWFVRDVKLISNAKQCRNYIIIKQNREIYHVTINSLSNSLSNLVYFDEKKNTLYQIKTQMQLASIFPSALEWIEGFETKHENVSTSKAAETHMMHETDCDDVPFYAL